MICCSESDFFYTFNPCSLEDLSSCLIELENYVSELDHDNAALDELERQPSELVSDQLTIQQNLTKLIKVFYLFQEKNYAEDNDIPWDGSHKTMDEISSANAFQTDYNTKENFIEFLKVVIGKEAYDGAITEEDVEVYAENIYG